MPVFQRTLNTSIFIANNRIKYRYFLPNKLNLNPYWQILENSSKYFSESSVFQIKALRFWKTNPYEFHMYLLCLHRCFDSMKIFEMFWMNFPEMTKSEKFIHLWKLARRRFPKNDMLLAPKCILQFYRSNIMFKVKGTYALSLDGFSKNW